MSYGSSSSAAEAKVHYDYDIISFAVNFHSTLGSLSPRAWLLTNVSPPPARAGVDGCCGSSFRLEIYFVPRPPFPITDGAALCSATPSNELFFIIIVIIIMRAEIKNTTERNRMIS